MKIILKPMGIAVLGTAIAVLAVLATVTTHRSAAASNSASETRTAAAAVLPASAASGIVYDGLLKNGWGNYSWAKVDLANATELKGGMCARVDASSFQALSFHHDIPVSAAPYDRVSFRINGGKDGGQLLKMVLRMDAPKEPKVGTEHLLAPLEAGNQWTTVTVSLADLGVPNTSKIVDIWFQEENGIKKLPTFYVTDVRLLQPGESAQ